MANICLQPHFCGKRFFNEDITITDPGYDKGTGWAINCSIKAGEYCCFKWTSNFYYTEDDGKKHRYQKVMGCSIFLEDYFPTPREWRQADKLGEISVDAGLAGFFENKPDYDDEAWATFCNKIMTGNAWLIDEGFFTSSGFGDGFYDVYKYTNEDNEIIGIYVDFN